MAIQWSGTSGRMRVGIDISFSTVTSGSTTVDVTIDYWIEIVNWNYSDNQTLNYNDPPGAGGYNYFNGFSSGQYKILTRAYTTAISYSGGPTHTASASISGAYDGSAPSVSRSYSIPARPAAVPSAPTVTVSNVGTSTASTSVSGAASNGSTIDSYETQIATNSGFTTGVQTKSGSASQSWTGLSASTTYYTRGRAHNGVGWSSYSSTKSFTTSATVPGAPTGVGNNTVGQTTANVTWTAPASNGGSAITAYQIQIAKDSGFTTSVETFEDPDDVSPYNLTSLSPATAYWARVRAVNGVGAGAWSSSTTFTTLTGTPSILTPTASEASSRGWPYAVVSAAGIDTTRTIRVEFSKDNTFATGVVFVELISAKTANDQYTLQDTVKKLTNGTWYVRAKVTNTSTGYVTPWSATTTFTVTHTPAAVASSPAAGSTSKYLATTPFIFSFTDPSTPDRMSAYQIIVEDNATGAGIHDSGKVVSAGNANPQSVTVNVAISSTWKSQTLRWRVRVWDRDDQVSAYTGYNTFVLADPPNVTITSPTNASTVNNGSPTFSWTATFPSGGTQASALVEVRDSSTNALVWSATVTGAGTSVTPNVVILTNGGSYIASVTVTDTKGLFSTVNSSFSASYQAPASVNYSFDATYADSLGYVDVAWPTSNADSLFVAWKIYRLDLTDPDGDWELIDETGDQNIRHYHDYLISAGKTYSYSVTQTAYRSGVVLESPVGYYKDDLDNTVAENRSVTPDLTHYWIIDPNNEGDSVLVPSVTSDSSTLEFETSSYTIIGRGRHRDYGDELGYSGSLTCQVRSTERPSVFRSKIEKLRRNQETYWLRTPFGRLFPIALGDIGWAPLPGTGVSEMGDMTIPYEQVS